MKPGRHVGEEGEIRQHSGWIIPLGVISVVALLCAAMMLYYLRPFALGRNETGPFRDSGPSVPLVVNGLSLSVPPRYLEGGGTTGGDKNSVALEAALPDMRGFSDSDARLFAGNQPDSPLVHVLIRAAPGGLDAENRLARIYMPYIAVPQGKRGPFGLTHYSFRANTGYGEDDLFSGNNGALLFLCERDAQDLPSPNCLAIDRPIAPGVSLSYRFKRAQLASWQAIDSGVNRLIEGFRKKG